MPWLPEDDVCQHPERPDITYTYCVRGRVWECSDCGGRWRARFNDLGHDVMPGEATYQMTWELVLAPRVD